MADFEVLYFQNHGGTFNGCLETLGISIESFLKGRVRDSIPRPVIFDHRTSVGKCFEYLMKRRKPFFVVGEDGNEKREIFEREQALFTQEANDLIEAWLDTRNFHVHTESLYSMMTTFSDISIPIGMQHLLVFNPGLANPERQKLRIDEKV